MMVAHLQRAMPYAYHSRSARPTKPTLIPLEDVNMIVLGQSASDLPSPNAGSNTFAKSQGKLHWFLKCLN